MGVDGAQANKGKLKTQLLKTYCYKSSEYIYGIKHTILLT